jgi:hypothetical protein
MLNVVKPMVVAPNHLFALSKNFGQHHLDLGQHCSDCYVWSQFCQFLVSYFCISGHQLHLHFW